MLEGAMQKVEDLEIDLLLEGVYRRYGHDFRGFRREPLKERLHAMMRQTGLQSVSLLQDRVMHDPASAAAFLRALSERPRMLFDDPAYFHALRAAMVPLLRTYPTPKIWIAECVSVEDACALSIMLTEEGLYERTQVFATAQNETLLREARSGQFPGDRMAEYAENYRKSGGKADFIHYCSQGQGSAAFSPELCANITWAQHSLASDASFNEFQLVLCRRNLSDFGDVLRQRVLQLFYDSMSFLGVLGVEGDAMIGTAPFSSRYQPIAVNQGLYRRVA